MTPTEAIISRSEDAKAIGMSPIFDVIDPMSDGLTAVAFGVHFLLKDSNYILIYDRLIEPEFMWYEARLRVNPNDCIFALMDAGLREITFEQVFNNISLYQQEHLLYMINIFTET